MGRKKRFTEEEESFSEFEEDDGSTTSSSRGEFLDSFGDEESGDWDIFDDDYDSKLNFRRNWMDYNNDSYN